MSNIYWMVERSINGSAHWWMRPPLNHEHWDSPHRWTADSAKAVHFPKKEAADLIVENDMCECFATEHMDIGGESQAERIAALERDLAAAQSYASTLAVSMHKQHYAEVAPNWQPLPDLVGLLTQIDNMYAGLRNDFEAAVVENKRG